MIGCKNFALWAKRCKNHALWIVRINADPDTDTPLCTIHADLTVRRCHPVPVTKTRINEEETTT